MKLGYAKILGCIGIVLLASLPVAGSSASEHVQEVKLFRQFGFFGFADKRVKISVNSDILLDSDITKGPQYYHWEVPAHVKIDISVGNDKQSETFVIDDSVKGFEIIYGKPISIRPIDYVNGDD